LIVILFSSLEKRIILGLFFSFFFPSFKKEKERKSNLYSIL